MRVQSAADLTFTTSCGHTPIMIRLWPTAYGNIYEQRAKAQKAEFPQFVVVQCSIPDRVQELSIFSPNLKRIIFTMRKFKRIFTTLESGIIF